MLLNFVNAQIHELEYYKTIIPIEAEKAGYMKKESFEEKNIRIKKREDLETDLYWPRITETENKIRYEKVLEFLDKISKWENFEKLSKENQEIWNKNIREKLLEKNIKETIDVDKYEEDKNMLIETQEKRENAEDYYISEELILPITKLLLEVEGIANDDIIIIQEDKNSEKLEKTEKTIWEKKEIIYNVPEKWGKEELYEEIQKKHPDDKNKFKIIKKNSWGMSVDIKKDNAWEYVLRELCLKPAIDGKYNLKDILDILADHEIATHVITQTNNANNLSIKSFDRNQIEEWIATLNQNFVEHRKIEEYYQTSIGDIWQVIWENFDQNDTLKILFILNILQGDTPKTAKKKAQTRARRIKIGVPEWELGTRRLDMRYWAGKNIIRDLEWLTETEEWRKKLQKMIKWFYLTRLWYKDLEHIDKILENISDLEHMNMQYPVFAGKILYNKLFSKHGKLDKKEMLKDDLRKMIGQPTISRKQLKLITQIKQLIENDSEFQKDKKI